MGGINFAWANHTFSATPGVPVRMSAVEQVRNNVFRIPCALESFHVAVPSCGFAVNQHKGGLMRVSPEEIAAAFLLAIARDITRKGTKEVLNRWYKFVRSTTCNFVLLPSEMDRHWYSLERRENCEHEFTAVHRSCFQRIYEVNRFAQKLRGTETSATAGAVFKEYSEKLKQHEHANAKRQGW